VQNTENADHVVPDAVDNDVGADRIDAMRVRQVRMPMADVRVQADGFKGCIGFSLCMSRMASRVISSNTVLL
jgi:hypothetical protein